MLYDTYWRESKNASEDNHLSANKELRQMRNIFSRRAQPILSRPSPIHKLNALARKLEAEGKPVIHLQIGDVKCPKPLQVTEEDIRIQVHDYPEDVGDLILERINFERTYGKRIDRPYPPEMIKRCVCAAEKKPSSTYAGMSGVPELKGLIAEYLNESRFNGCVIDPAGVIPTAGAAGAMSSALLTFTDRSDRVILHGPTYSAFWEQVVLAGCRPVDVPLEEEEEWLLDPEKVEEAATKYKPRLMIICSPNNPTGSVLDRNCLEELAGVAERHDMLVLSDETYDRTIYDGLEHESIASIIPSRTLIIGSFSKAYAMTGERLGYIAGESELTIPVSKIQHKLYLYPLQSKQSASVVIFKDPKTDLWLDERLKELTRRRDVLIEGLAKIPSITCVKPKGAIYVFPNISEIFPSSDEFAYRLLNEVFVQVAPGIGFGPTGEGHVRISFGPVGVRGLEEAIYRIDKFAERHYRV
ncbi:MAG: pyridoxal phosphate-dependent aminotransferase [Candidatus Bathyarchaeia archaeon]